MFYDKLYHKSLIHLRPMQLLVPKGHILISKTKKIFDVHLLRGNIFHKHDNEPITSKHTNIHEYHCIFNPDRMQPPHNNVQHYI